MVTITPPLSKGMEIWIVDGLHDDICDGRNFIECLDLGYLEMHHV